LEEKVYEDKRSKFNFLCSNKKSASSISSSLNSEEKNDKSFLNDNNKENKGNEDNITKIKENRKKNETIKVALIHYNCWPDMGIPSSSKEIIYLLLMTHNLTNGLRNTAVVHCRFKIFNND